MNQLTSVALLLCNPGGQQSPTFPCQEPQYWKLLSNVLQLQSINDLSAAPTGLTVALASAVKVHLHLVVVPIVEGLFQGKLILHMVFTSRRGI